MLELKVDQFGFRLLWFVGLLGEMPVSLVRYMNGYYDYNRRVVTQLVREGYLRERKFERNDRHKIRSLSLTDQGLKHIQHLSPGRANLIRKHLLAPADGQGNWARTQRLHRNACCLFMAMKMDAGWVPGQALDDAVGKRLVYYSTYGFNKTCGKDNKSARVSGLLLTPKKDYYCLYYLGNRNLQWNLEVEKNFRHHFESSEIGRGFDFRGNILIGETWELAAKIVQHAVLPYSRLIRFAPGENFFYAALEPRGWQLLRLATDDQELYEFQQFLKNNRLCEISMFPKYLFELDLLSSYYEPPDSKRSPIRPTRGHFFEFQMPAMERINNTGAQLEIIGSDWFDYYWEEEGDQDGE